MDSMEVENNRRRAAPSSEISSPRNSKRRRFNRSRESPTRITPYQLEGSIGISKQVLKSPKSVVSSVSPDRKERRSLTRASQDDTQLPPANNKVQLQFEQTPSVMKSAASDSSASQEITNETTEVTEDPEKNSSAVTESSPRKAPSRERLNVQMTTGSTVPRSRQSNNFFPKFLSVAVLLVACGCGAAAFFSRTTPVRAFQHVIAPKHVLDSIALLPKGAVQQDNNGLDMDAFLTNTTLRDFLTDPQGFHLAMAPSFFGFYGYFGMLAAWDEGLTVESETNTTIMATDDDNNDNDQKQSYLEQNRIQSVAGASAGAMAAMLLALGIPPRKAAQFCGTIDLPTFADPPGIGCVFKGDKFEQLMYDFIKAEMPHNSSLQMQESKIPVAVTGFDLQTMSTLVMRRGCVARSARASATFPFLFQPVHWFDDGTDDVDTQERGNKDYVLIDGGVLDRHGLEGLTVMEPDNSNKRVVNVVVGTFGGVGYGAPPGPSEMPTGLAASEVLSISIQNLPMCGPWAMEQGPRAVEAANKAMLASLDLPLFRGKEDGHYELHIDASSFVQP